ncbi:hypothetical protein GCM10010172_76230 [Paractinoplanes ferrugineus]|uniref:DUF3253 domain-containing protein n=1 Tax=Paractinoplanes ferrugineus TaxID=113564 RepID=A0A919MCZ2_9ACTN|nr:DUF3253 domain-containing protein [Actinoplanes ferrugineus]GIE11223.1 hypothetical protein Afe05nite_30630 [Actinoplanes ferrugineus]
MRRGADGIPEPLRRELEAELTAARRSAAAPSAPSAPDMAGARIEDAQLALGHRHHPGDLGARLAATMRALLRHRKPESTICPSDAARVVGGESWRDLMHPAREVAADLAGSGVITVRQHGTDVDISEAVGPIRLARGPNW